MRSESLPVDIEAYPQTTESKTDLGLEIHVNHKKGNIYKFKIVTKSSLQCGGLYCFVMNIFDHMFFNDSPV